MSAKKEGGDWFLVLFVVVIAAGLLYLDWWRQGELVNLNERLDNLEHSPAPAATQPLPGDAA